ncbi:MAG: VanZ family protein [Sediminibacterium sp.]
MKLWWVNLPKKYRTAAHILWAVVVFGLHAMPSKSFPKISFWENLGPDKFVHAFMFFVATALAVFSGWGKLRSATVWICAGVLLEYYQFYFTTDRSFDWFDVLADATGVFIALVILKGTVSNRG